MCTSSSSNNSLLAIHSTKTDSLERKRVSLSTKRTSDTDSTGENENDNSQAKKIIIETSSCSVTNSDYSPPVTRLTRKRAELNRSS